MIGSQAICHLQEKFKVNGKPMGGKNKVYGKSSRHSPCHQDTTEILLSTGKFIKSKSGIAFHPDFVNEIRQIYPDQPIEALLQDNQLFFCRYFPGNGSYARASYYHE